MVKIIYFLFLIFLELMHLHELNLILQIFIQSKENFRLSFP